MTPEEIRLENLKQMAMYSGPIVSFEFREPFYLASCDACGWVGSTEHCGSDSFGDDSDVYCPRCHANGADCGKVAESLSAASPLLPHLIGWREIESAPKDGTKFFALAWQQDFKNWVVLTAYSALLKDGRRFVYNRWSTGLVNLHGWMPLPPAPEAKPPHVHDEDHNDDDYYRRDESGYSRADEEWFFDMDGKP